MSNSAPSDLKLRLLAQIEKEPAPTRRDATLLTLVLALGAIALAVVVFEFAGGFRPVFSKLPRWFVFGGAAGWLGAAALATLASFWRGRRMSGRPWQVLGATVIVTPVIMFAWMHLWGGTVSLTWPVLVGYRCLSMTLGVGVLPLTMLLLARRGTVPAHPRLAGAALGATAGAWSGVVVDLWCPIPDVSHVLIGHILPLLLLAAVGAALGRRLLGVSYRG